VNFVSYHVKYNINCRIVFILLAVVGFAVANSYARDNFDLHKVDFYRVLGIERSQGGRLEDLFAMLHEIIDQKGGNSDFIRELKDKFGLTFGGAQKHRYIFHWGFNADLKDHEPLMKELDKVRDKIKKKLEDESSEYYKEYQEVKESMDVDKYIDKKVLDFINKERAAQNRRLINKCMEVTGLDRSMSAGLITILWDIHILSDYLGQITEGMLDFPSLSIDLCRHGLERLFEQDNKDPVFREKFDNALEQLENIYGGDRREKERACDYLNFLCGYSDCNSQALEGNGAIANLLRESNVVKGILSKKGIPIKV